MKKMAKKILIGKRASTRDFCIFMPSLFPSEVPALRNLSIYAQLEDGDSDNLYLYVLQHWLFTQADCTMCISIDPQ